MFVVWCSTDAHSVLLSPVLPDAVGRARHFDLESIPGPQDPEKFSFWVSLVPADS